MKKKIKLGQKAPRGAVIPMESKGVEPADRYTMFLFGPPKIGKTSFAVAAEIVDGRPMNPDKLAFVIATEAAHKHLDIRLLGCEDWTTFLSIVDGLRPEKQGIERVVVDTVDNLFMQCNTYVCDKMGIDHPADEEWGKGYAAVRDEFMMGVTKLALKDCSLVFISHEKTIEVKGRITKTQRVVPTLPNQGCRVIFPMVDIMGHVGFSMDRSGEPTRNRIMEFEPSELTMAGDRFGLLPRRIPLDFRVMHGYLDGTSLKGAPPKSGPRFTIRRRR